VKVLTPREVSSFRENGFLFPLPMLSRDEVARCLDALERYERWLGMPLTRADRTWSTMPYIHLPWFDALLRDPRVLDAIEDLIGPDILVWTSTFWIKEPGSPAFAAWHQDSAYFGHEPDEVVTVWLALNRGGQTIVEALEESAAVAMALPAGSFSIHHGLCPHQSHPNRAAFRRIGLGFNYMPAHVRTSGSERLPAMLVRGTDRWGNFDLYEPSPHELDAEGLALHERVYARYARNYREQQARHELAFAPAGSNRG